MTWVKETTAIMVIHGVGEQDPYMTLDQFAQGLLPVLADRAGVPLTISHRLQDMGGWTDNYISIRPQGGPDGENLPSIDLHEYYWAHRVQRKVNLQQVFDWLLTVGDQARQFYDANLQLTEYYEGQGDDAFGKRFGFFGRRVFKRYWYLKYGGFALRAAQIILSLVPALLSGGNLLTRLIAPLILQPLRLALRVVSPLVKSLVVDYVGDIVAYTATDRKSEHYAVRRDILDGAVAKLKQLLERTNPRPYQRVVIAGHSLGSVIAYDAINRLNHQLNTTAASDPASSVTQALVETQARKLAGLVTFGSPLDKVAFFLRVRAKEDQHIRRQILSNFHSFRAADWEPNYEPPESLKLENTITPYLDNLVWLNFWDAKDPVAGPLDFYLVDYSRDALGNRVPSRTTTGSQESSSPTPDFQGNVKIELGKPWGVAHVNYWSDREMYQQLVDRILLAELPEPPPLSDPAETSKTITA